MNHTLRCLTFLALILFLCFYLHGCDYKHNSVILETSKGVKSIRLSPGDTFYGKFGYGTKHFTVVDTSGYGVYVVADTWIKGKSNGQYVSYFDLNTDESFKLTSK